MICEQICVSVFLTGIGISAHFNNSIFAVVFILLTFYSILLPNVFWIYMSEVCNDNQLGVAATAFYINGVILSIITEYLIEFFGVDGVFFLFAFL